MNQTAQSILITGATGKLGRQLVRESVQRGLRPICMVRAASDVSELKALGLELRTADLRNRESLATAVAGIDVIIHTAAMVDFRGDRLTQFTGVNAMGALDLFRAAVVAGVKRFVHVSTVAAVGALPYRAENSGPPMDEVASESHEFNLSHLRIPYIMTKRAAEEELWKSAADSGTELVMINPSIIVAASSTGDDRMRFRQRFDRWWMPEFRNRLNLVDIRDVVPAIINAVFRGRDGERYILAGDNISMRDLVLSVSAVIARQPFLVRLPRWAIEIAARMSHWWYRIRGRSNLSFYPDLVKLLDYDWVYSSEKAHRELGFQARSVHETLRDFLNNRLARRPIRETG